MLLPAILALLSVSGAIGIYQYARREGQRRGQMTAAERRADDQDRAERSIW